MSYRPDTLEGVVEFCDDEGQPCESVREAIKLTAERDALREERDQLAKDVLSLADDGGMPDSYKQTDQRMVRARAALSVPKVLKDTQEGQS